MTDRFAAGAAAARALTFLLVSLLSACTAHRHRSAEGPRAHFAIGGPWKAEGVWFYPREEFSYQATGLGIIDGPRNPAQPLTADGERYDPSSPSGAHQTLQLPSALTVRNLENGRQITLTINDRGPTSPHRLLSVTPRAGQLLGMEPGRPARLSVIEDVPLSQLLLRDVEGAPEGDVVGAPVGTVDEQALDGPAFASTAGESHRKESEPISARSLAELEGRVSYGPRQPGRLWVEAGRFSNLRFARMLSLRLRRPARIETDPQSSLYIVLAGPFDQVEQVDAALDQVRSAGVTGARIIVQ